MRYSRRLFLRRTAWTGAFLVLPSSWFRARSSEAPSNQIRIAGVGAGGQGGADIAAAAQEGAKIVGLCDVDPVRAADTYKRFPEAKQYVDFRIMLDELDREIDAVIVGTPDHTHAVVVAEAMRRGKHVYCEKPLARTVSEVRRLMELARNSGVVTQLGNQGHSFGSIRQLCEWVWAGAIGQVSEVHAACDAFPNVYCQIENIPKLAERYETPQHLAWDLWIGPVTYRPYTPFYHPFNWRGWLSFGTGCIGDWFCHVMDPAFWALGLKAPVRVKAEVSGYDPVRHGLTYPPATRIEFDFPADGSRGPVKVVWYDGQNRLPRLAGIPQDEQLPGTGAILVGTKGFIVHGSHGAGGCHILPDQLMDQYSGKNAPPQSIPRVKNHMWDWLQAIREGRRAGSDFSYGGLLTQSALLGLVAVRFPGQVLEWDDKTGRFTNFEPANYYLEPHYRPGWKL